MKNMKNISIALIFSILLFGCSKDEIQQMEVVSTSLDSKLYGIWKTTYNHPDNFGSVQSTDFYLSFSENGNSAFWSEDYIDPWGGGLISDNGTNSWWVESDYLFFSYFSTQIYPYIKSSNEYSISSSIKSADGEVLLINGEYWVKE